MNVNGLSWCQVLDKYSGVSRMWAWLVPGPLADRSSKFHDKWSRTVRRILQTNRPRGHRTLWVEVDTPVLHVGEQSLDTFCYRSDRLWIRSEPAEQIQLMVAVMPHTITIYMFII